MTLTDKRAVITGASQGLGRKIAQEFLREGAHVLICARTCGDLEHARLALNREFPGRIHAIACDISVEKEVEALAREAERLLGGVDILVSNAGVYGPMGSTDEVDWAKWTEAIQINLIGTAYCCRVFVPLLKKGRRGKIVILSGGGATKPLPFLSAYAASKAAVVRFGETLSEELKAFGVDVNLIAPGALNTRLLDEVLHAGPHGVGEAFFSTALAQKKSGGTPLEHGANLCVYLASNASDGISGRLISAQWDPWQRLGELREELMASDVYTLRRIVPADRGKAWDCK